MKNYAIPVLVLLTSCKTYHYMTPTINTAMYSKAGEVQAGLQFGSAGIAANGGVAISKNININGYASFFPETDNGYNSRELEFSLGYQINSGGNKKRATSFFLGFGHGDNEYDKKGLAGRFTRPFIQIQHGIYDRRSSRVPGAFDFYFGSRFNFLMYNGTFGGTDIDDDQFYYEPYYGFSFGGSNVRCQFLMGIPIKTGNWEDGVRVLPIFANIGLQIKFRKR
jgi:hypothetical protein